MRRTDSADQSPPRRLLIPRAFPLCHKGQYAYGEAVSVRHVGRGEVDVGIAELQKERGVAGEAVQPGNRERGLTPPALAEGSLQLRTIVPAARLYLGKLGDSSPAGGGYEAGD